MKRFATAAILALAATTVLAAPAIAKTGTTEDRTVMSAPQPAVRLSLTAGPFSNVAPQAEPDRFVQVADARTRQRRTRMAIPRRTVVKRHVATPRFKTAGRKNGTNAPAPLDCSIESHPDCQKPAPRTVFGWGAAQYQYTFEGTYY